LVAAIADAEQVGTFWQNAFMTVSYTAASLRSRGLTGSVFLESCSWRRRNLWADMASAGYPGLS
jgi:hypothetical protein